MRKTVRVCIASLGQFNSSAVPCLDTGRLQADEVSRPCRVSPLPSGQRARHV
jgi:hypothetical protein